MCNHCPRHDDADRTAHDHRLDADGSAGGRRDTGPDARDGLRRRTVLRGAAATATAGLGATAGCLGGGAESTATDPPEPIALDDGVTCDVCGMVIADHGGPSGQVFYAGDHPPDRDGPARYDSLAELVTDRAAAVDRGREPVATYVTDYAAVEYGIRESGGDRVISSHAAAEAFVDWRDAVYAVESGVVGAMGPDLVPFSERDAAESFVDAESGRIVESEAVSVDLVSSL